MPSAIPITDLPPGALRRLAHAVSVGGAGRYAVMSLVPPLFTIAAVAPSEAAANAIHAGLPAAQGPLVVVGPVETDPDDPPVLPGPVHLPWCEMILPPSPHRPPGRPHVEPPHLSDVTRVSVTVELGHGDPITATFDGPADAFFLTRSACERFVYPYYQAAFGSEYVAALRQRLDEGNA